MMAVIVNQLKADAVMRHHAKALKATSDTTKAGERANDRIVAHAEILSNGNRSQCVAYVVQTSDPHGDLQRSAAGTMHGEAHGHTVGDHIGRANVGVASEAIGSRWVWRFSAIRWLRQDHRCRRRASHKRQPMGEVDKRLQTFKTVTMGFHVIGVDVGDHRQRRRQVQERGVRFIGLRHQKLTGTQGGHSILRPAGDRQ